MLFKNLVASSLKRLANLFLFTALLLASGPGWAKSFYQDLRKELRSLKIKSNPKRSDPDYPAFVFLKTINSMQSFKPDVVIEKLEQLLLSKNFRVRLNQKSKDRFHVELGTAGSFALWRDLFYLTLGRAYYDKKLYHRALKYFNSVGTNSPYYGLATLQYNYAALQMLAISRVAAKLATIENRQWKSPGLAREYKLQQAFVHLRQKKYTQAIQLAQSNLPKRATVKAFRSKILAEAHFKAFLADYNQIDFKQRVQRLQLIESLVNSVPMRFRNSELAYLAAEAYWHHASALRVQDPVKYKKEWHDKLSKGEAWLGHYVNQSIKLNKPLMTEEAFFFSVFLLWERERFSKALTRLKSLHTIYPQGIYRADAYQLVADYYYDQNQFNRAIIYYRKLAGIGTDDKASYAVYKAGWSYYNSEKKWKALRHFERLVKFYQDQKKAKKAGPSELEKESRQDLILVMAETMRAPNAIKELHSIGFSASDLVLVKSDLAKVYQKIGRFKESITTWEHVLDNYPQDKSYLQWLVSLAQDYHSIGNRVKVASQVEHYYGKWMQLAADKPEKMRLAFFKDWEKLILSVHKEARKTDDPQIWKATDLTYKVFEKIGRTTENGNLWYFGAQRKERLAKYWDSIRWYQNASYDKQFKLAVDSGLSALRLTHQMNEDLSIETDKSKKLADYKKVAAASKWFIDNFPKSFQIELAQSIYIEALYQSKEFLVALAYFKQVLSTAQFDSAWKLYQSFNNRLYLAKDWQRAYSFSTEIEGISNIESNKKDQFVRDIRKEAAFQLAYKFEREKKKDLVKIAKWYETSIGIQGELDATFKAWHNLVLNFGKGHEQKLYSYLNQFIDKKYPIKTKDHINLAFNMFKQGINVFEKAGDRLKKAFALYEGSTFASYDEISKLMLWEALILYSSYQAWDRWDRVLQKINKRHPGYLDQSDQKLTLARLYFYRENFERAWKLLASELDGKHVGQVHWQLYLDLYNNISSSSALFDEMVEHIKNNQKRMSKVGELQTVWHYWHRSKWQEDQGKMLSGRDKLQRGIASVDDSVSGKEPIEKLKAKLAHVGTILKGLKQEKALINKYLKVSSPQIAKEAICKAPEITKASIEALMDLKDDPVASSQWKDFTAKLDAKAQELQKIIQNEAKACAKVKREFAYFEKRSDVRSLLCDGDRTCLGTKSLSANNIRSMEQELAEKGKVERFLNYVQQGALAKAELLSIKEKDRETQVFFNALIRLALNDKVGAEGFLESLKSSKQWKHRALNLKTYMAYKQNPQGFVPVNKTGWKTQNFSPVELSWLQQIP